jgi:hypothetical protein
MSGLHAAQQVLAGLKRAEDLFAGSRPSEMPQAHVAPKPPPPPTAHGEPPCCYIVGEDGDVNALCPPGTKIVTYYDKHGNYVSKDLQTGHVNIMAMPGPDPDMPNLCHLPSATADRSICGPGTTEWDYPGAGGNLIFEELQPNGTTRIRFNTPPGPLVP